MPCSPRAVLFVLTLVLAAVAGTARSAEPVPVPLDMLVVAPHSDDETIGCAATMTAAIQAGKRVGVVVVTNGDGFPIAAAAVAKKPQDQLKPADYLALTALRQRHSIGAMAHIGVRTEDLIFLGYPDAVLSDVYAAAGPEPVTSQFTGKSETYGALVTDYHSQVHSRPAPYVKAAAVGDMAEILHTRRPKEIYVTSELDPPVPGDHQATFLIVRDAARAAGWRGTLWTYIVHAQGRVSPPGPVRRVPLSDEQFRAKRSLLERYQVGLSPVHDQLAERFTRHEELFWPVKIE